jgi:erythromycin esterase-like protein
MYGYAATKAKAEPCANAVVDQLMELRRRATELIAPEQPGGETELFYAEQNARLIANAEQYYRAMFGGRASSWNVRDQHMANTLQALRSHFDPRWKQARRLGAQLSSRRRAGDGDERARRDERGAARTREVRRRSVPDRV